MYFQKKKDQVFVNEFVEKLPWSNEIFKKKMAFVQILYENFANKHRQNKINEQGLILVVIQ